MLNISSNSVSGQIRESHYVSMRYLKTRKSRGILVKFILANMVVAVLVSFLPWTQNIQSKGYLTTLKPDQRPQTIHSIIAGRIESWYVQEGDFVNKGDTILFISEIKDDYFDPNLLGNTQDQLKSKELSVGSYMEKVKALDNQIDALVQTSALKMKQTRNKYEQSKLKVTSDSIDYTAAVINFSTAKSQYDRFKTLYEKGLKSLTDLENRNLKLQKAESEMIAKKNKLLTSENEVINAQVEILSIQAQYRDDIAKAESEKYTAMSNMYDAEATVTKLQNQYMNYSVRNNMYYITAPQSGYITKAIQSGIGETIKEGTEIISIMPAVYDLTIAMYVRPIDLPLLQIGQKVRILFDGWPAIVFSGWPNTSYGTYGGELFAIDNFISDNGMYRVLVAPDKSDNPWPKALRVGGGTRNMLLLNDVPVWYELWRQVNGFPADFYNEQNSQNTQKAKKK